MTTDADRGSPEFLDTVLQAPGFAPHLTPDLTAQLTPEFADFDPLCALCAPAEPGTLVLLHSGSFRIVRVLDAAHPVFYRLIWQQHVAEFSLLSAAERHAMMAAVADIEATLLAVLTGPLRPTKINLASLGNVVPHLHWHIVARYLWDSHYPRPIWSEAVREPDAAKLEALHAALSEIDRRLIARFSPDIAL